MRPSRKVRKHANCTPSVKKETTGKLRLSQGRGKTSKLRPPHSVRKEKTVHICKECKRKIVPLSGQVKKDTNCAPSGKKKTTSTFRSLL